MINMAKRTLGFIFFMAENSIVQYINNPNYFLFQVF